MKLMIALTMLFTANLAFALDYKTVTSTVCDGEEIERPYTSIGVDIDSHMIVFLDKMEDTTHVDVVPYVIQSFGHSENDRVIDMIPSYAFAASFDQDHATGERTVVDYSGEQFQAARLKGTGATETLTLFNLESADVTCQSLVISFN